MVSISKMMTREFPERYDTGRVDDIGPGISYLPLGLVGKAETSGSKRTGRL
jgi:hypothetical protein